MRINKLFSNFGICSRKETNKIIREGRVIVNGKPCIEGQWVELSDEILLDGKPLVPKEKIYIALNKPVGVVCTAAEEVKDNIIDYLGIDDYVFPIGRLDKDSQGLIILTNDGDLNHKLISPKYHVDKVYYAKIDKAVDEKDVEAFKNGITLDDGYKCMSAKLKVIENLEDSSRVEVTVQEGKYHQVKRMFEARGKKVVYLKRTSFGNLPLDESLEEGEYKELSESELAVLYKNF